MNLQNKSHGEITRVCMGIFPTAVRNKKCGKILNKNTSPYFHSISLAVWPLTMLKRTHFGPTQNSSTYTVVSFQLTSNLTFPENQKNWKPAWQPFLLYKLSLAGDHTVTVVLRQFLHAKWRLDFWAKRQCFRCFIKTRQVLFKIITRLNYVTESLVTVCFSVCCYRQLHQIKSCSLFLKCSYSFE